MAAISQNYPGIRLLRQAGSDMQKIANQVAQEGEDSIKKDIAQLEQEKQSSQRRVEDEFTQGYRNFIAASREIGQIRDDLNELHHLINTQVNLLQLEVDNSRSSTKKNRRFALNANDDAEYDDKYDMMKLLLDEIDGGSYEIRERMREKKIVMEGTWCEVDQKNGKKMHPQLYAYLFNDSLLLTQKLVGQRKQFLTLYELNDVRLCKDLQAPSVVVQALTGTERQCLMQLQFCNTFAAADASPRAFLAKSDIVKGTWLRTIETTKQQLQTSTLADTSLTDFGERLDADLPTMFAESAAVNARDALPDWFTDAHDTIDIHIALRNYEQAVDLCLQCQRFIAAEQTKIDREAASHRRETAQRQRVFQEQKIRVEGRIAGMTDKLSALLRHGSTQGHGNALLKDVTSTTFHKRRQGDVQLAVKLLRKLDQTQLACDLWLRARSDVIMDLIYAVCYEVHIEPYANAVCYTFFYNFFQTTVQFHQMFVASVAQLNEDDLETAGGHETECTSLFLVWADKELRKFITRLYDQLIGSHSSPSVGGRVDDPIMHLDALATLYNCIATNYQELFEKKLLHAKLGLDLRFIIDKFFRPLVQDALKERETDLNDEIEAGFRENEAAWGPMSRVEAQAIIEQFDALHWKIGALLDMCNTRTTNGGGENEATNDETERSINVDRRMMIHGLHFVQFMCDIRKCYIRQLHADFVHSVISVLTNFRRQLNLATKDGLIRRGTTLYKSNVVYLFDVLTEPTVQIFHDLVGSNTKELDECLKKKQRYLET